MYRLAIGLGCSFCLLAPFIPELVRILPLDMALGQSKGQLSNIFDVFIAVHFMDAIEKVIDKGLLR